MTRSVTGKTTDLDDVLSVLTDFQAMVAQKFDAVDTRFEMIDARFDTIDAKLADHHRKFDHPYSVLDSHIKRMEEIMQENVMRDRQQDRMQQWIFQLADKLGVKLKYE